MKQSVIHYVLSRLSQLGITDVFGVPGDYAFPINDAISEDQHLRWIGSSNELNAAYAADGYARIKGVAAVNTTYGVGELSALNALAGAYASTCQSSIWLACPTRPPNGHERWCTTPSAMGNLIVSTTWQHQSCVLAPSSP